MTTSTMERRPASPPPEAVLTEEKILKYRVPQAPQRRRSPQRYPSRTAESTMAWQASVEGPAIVNNVDDGRREPLPVRRLF